MNKSAKVLPKRWLHMTWGSYGGAWGYWIAAFAALAQSTRFCSSFALSPWLHSYPKRMQALSFRRNTLYRPIVSKNQLTGKGFWSLSDFGKRAYTGWNEAGKTSLGIFVGHLRGVSFGALWPETYSQNKMVPVVRRFIHIVSLSWRILRSKHREAASLES
jgi:hypothetical protein